MKQFLLVVILGGMIPGSLVWAQTAREEVKVCALCGNRVVVVKESFSYPFICQACLAWRMKSILKLPHTSHSQDAVTLVPEGPGKLTYADGGHKQSSPKFSAVNVDAGVTPFTLNLERFFKDDQLQRRRSKKMVFLRSERTGKERRDGQAFKSSIEQEAALSLAHMWKYQVGADSRSITVQSDRLPERIETYRTKEPFEKMFYRNGCVVFLLPRGYEVHDFSNGRTAFFSKREKEKLEHYLYTEGHNPGFKEYVVASSERGGKKPTSIGLIPTHHYALADDQKTLLVGNEDGYVFKWSLGIPVEELFARGDEAAVITADGAQLVQDFSRLDEGGALMVRDHPIDVLAVERAGHRDLMEQGFVRVRAPERTLDYFLKELAVVPRSHTYNIYQMDTLETLVAHLRKREAAEEDWADRKFSCSLTIEGQDLESREAVITVTDNLPAGPWEEELVLNRIDDPVWLRGGQVVTWDHNDLMSFNYETHEATRFVFPPEITRAMVAQTMPELAFTELRKAAS